MLIPQKQSQETVRTSVLLTKDLYEEVKKRGINLSGSVRQMLSEEFGFTS